MKIEKSGDIFHTSGIEFFIKTEKMNVMSFTSRTQDSTYRIFNDIELDVRKIKKDMGSEMTNEEIKIVFNFDLIVGLTSISFRILLGQQSIPVKLGI